MEMHALGRFLVNSRLWNFFNRRYVLPLLLEHILSNDYARVLDVGCGVGYTTKALASRLPKALVYGVDYDQRQIVRARHLHAAEHVQFSVDDGKHLHFSDGFFDAVFAFDTLHHIEQYALSLREIYRVLRRGGDLYVLDIAKKYFSAPVRWLDNTQSFFSKNELVETARNVGFTVLRTGEKGLFFYSVCRK